MLASIVTGRQLVDNDQLLLRLAESRKTLGVASQLDVDKQVTVLRTDEVNLVKAERDLLVAQADLAQLLNSPRSFAISPSESLQPLGSWDASLQDTIESALDYRQVIVKNLSQVKQNELQAEIDLAIYRPTIELVNSLYWTKIWVTQVVVLHTLMKQVEVTCGTLNPSCELNSPVLTVVVREWKQWPQGSAPLLLSLQLASRQILSSRKFANIMPNRSRVVMRCCWPLSAFRLLHLR